ncbi:MAG: hypothetical protein MUF10_07540 [Thermoanaerobaculaceae bacterium]|jgi:hypothetical protein|nr:hypothetical protein [Thermoanaerobaculaceae bacterium]
MPAGPPRLKRLRHAVFGKPRDLRDRRLFEHLSLVALLAWVGLGAGEVERLQAGIRASLDRYVALANRLGFPARERMRIGTDRLDEAEALCREVLAEMPRTMVFAGKLIFLKERWFHPILHNQMAFSLQCRLQWKGLGVVILPLRV